MQKTFPITKGSKTRSRILRAAMELFNMKGYHATSISEIIVASRVQKGNLYFYFSSKEELALNLIEEARQEYMAYLSEHAVGDTALARLNGVLSAIFEFHRGKGFMGGCIFGNIALEMGDQNARFSSLIREVFEEWVDLLAGMLEEAVRQREISPALGPRLLARHIVAALEGGIMLSRLTKSQADMEGSIEAVRALLKGYEGNS